VPEMKEDPSEPAYRSRLQTAVSCCRPMAVVVNVHGKGARTSRHVRVGETSASEPLLRPRKDFYWHQNRSSSGLREEHGGYLVTGHAVSGVQGA